MRLAGRQYHFSHIRSYHVARDDDDRGLRPLDGARVIAVKGDFTQPLELPGLAGGGAQLDGILLANALHFVRDTERVLSRLVKYLRPGGRVVLVEYDRRGASRWVPYPIPSSRWPGLATSARLTEPKITATRPSSHAGILYTGVATRGASEP